MIQRGGCFGFALEAAERLRIFGDVVRQKLQRHKAAELDVFRLINHTHTAATELFQDAVVRDGLPWEWLGLRHSGIILG